MMLSKAPPLLHHPHRATQHCCHPLLPQTSPNNSAVSRVFCCRSLPLYTYPIFTTQLTPVVLRGTSSHCHPHSMPDHPPSCPAALWLAFNPMSSYSSPSPTGTLFTSIPPSSPASFPQPLTKPPSSSQPPRDDFYPPPPSANS